MQQLLRNKQIRALIAFGLIALAAYLLDIPFPLPKTPEKVNGFYKVMQVSDGDTIAILKDGERIPVRLIGIDSPEVDTSFTKSECFGTESSLAARTLLDGQMVRIETDPTQDMYDAYQRLLAYVFLSGSTTPVLVNEYLIAQGYAREYTFKKPYVYQLAFQSAEAEARALKKGLWGACQSSS